MVYSVINVKGNTKKSSKLSRAAARAAAARAAAAKAHAGYPFKVKICVTRSKIARIKALGYPLL